MSYHTMSSPSMHLSFAMARLEVDNSSCFARSQGEPSSAITTSASPLTLPRSLSQHQLADAQARTQKALHRASKKAAMKAAMDRAISQPPHLKTPKARRKKLKGRVGEKRRKERCYERESLQAKDSEPVDEPEWGIYSSPMARVEQRRGHALGTRREGDCMLVNWEYAGYGPGVSTPRR